MLSLLHEPPLHYAMLTDHEQVNRDLLAGFEREVTGPRTRQSHYELGRYENTYIDREAIPEIEPLCQAALEAGRQILGRDDLKLGFWFNIMQPGQRTARHNHEEDNELLSCVYYLEVAQDCGDLLVYPAGETVNITPQAGRFVFFPPKLAHAVEENRSGQRRLSVAFNFGPAESS